MSTNDTTEMGKTTLVIACGAIAHELVAVIEANNLDHIDIQCLPAEWHNTPDKIAPKVDALLKERLPDYESGYVAYADCGTGGHLDSVIEKYGVERLPGAHCYAFFAGLEEFDAIAEDELGTFFLTDYLALNFDRLIYCGLGIDRYPELMNSYFGHYKRVLYLAQFDNPDALNAAHEAAASLNLPLTIHRTGLKPFENALAGIPVRAQPLK